MKRIRFGKWRKFLLAVFFLLAAAAIALGQGMTNMNRTLTAMATARARQLATDELNSALEHVMDASLTYADFVSVTQDAAGRVNMISANTMLMNALATEAAALAQTRLDEMGDHGVQIPAGAAFGAGIFSGTGPVLRFSIIPVGTVTTGFVTEFEDACINQTRHKISLEAVATVRIVIPSGTEPISVSAKVPVAESILIGEVPESFIQVPEVDDGLNFMP